MEATIALRAAPCRMRRQTRWCRRQFKNSRSDGVETVGRHAPRAAVQDKAAWSLYRVRVPW